MSVLPLPPPDEHTIYVTLEGKVDTYEYDPLSAPLPGATGPLPGKALRSQQEVIIKHVTAEKDYRLFWKEYQAYQRIQQHGGHKHLLAPIEMMLAAERIPSYIIFPLMPGADLVDLVEPPGSPLAVAESVLITEQLTDALQFLHTIGVVHRDLSLCNIRICEMGKDKSPDISTILYDLNNSSLFNGVPLSARNENVGSPEYTAPEIWRSGHFDYRADLYSLGVAVFAMLTGKFPYTSQEEKTLPLVEDLRKKHLYDAIPAASAQNQKLLKRVDDFFEKALAKKPEQRFQSAQEFNKEFQELW